MRYILSAVCVCCGLCAMTIGGLLLLLRRVESNAYWLTYESSFPVVVHRRLPDGHIRNFQIDLDDDIDLWDWTPDGRWLLFSQYNHPNLYRVRAGGGRVQRLTNMNALIRDAMLSPDGQWVVFIAGEGLSWRLYRVRASGGKVERLTKAYLLMGYAEWTSDGDWIAFVASDDEVRWSIYRIRPDGSDLSQVYESPYAGNTGVVPVPIWSPDGEWIIFGDARVVRNTQIFRVRADGSRLEALTGDDVEHFSPVFARGGLYVSSNPGGTYNIYRISADEPRQAITTGLDNTYVLSASPDGEWLLTVRRQYTGSRGPFGVLQLVSVDGSHSQDIRALVTSQPRPTIWSPLIDLPFRVWMFFSFGVIIMAVGAGIPIGTSFGRKPAAAYFRA